MRKPAKRKSSAKNDPPDATILEITEALKSLPLPARAIVSQHINELDKFRRRYPRLYDFMFKNVDSRRYREFERHLERVQDQKRGRA